MAWGSRFFEGSSQLSFGFLGNWGLGICAGAGVVALAAEEERESFLPEFKAKLQRMR